MYQFVWHLDDINLTWRECMKNIVIVVLVAGALVYAALNYHFILLDKKVRILKKTDMTLEYTFVDARGRGKLKLFLTPALIRAGIKDVL
jgi:hypothetical protein